MFLTIEISKKTIYFSVRVRLIESVRLIGGPLNRGFIVLIEVTTIFFIDLYRLISEIDIIDDLYRLLLVVIDYRFIDYLRLEEVKTVRYSLFTDLSFSSL